MGDLSELNPIRQLGETRKQTYDQGHQAFYQACPDAGRRSRCGFSTGDQKFILTRAAAGTY